MGDGPQQHGDRHPDDEGEDEQELGIVVATEPPSHFLGIHGGEVDPILRMHLKLEDKQGILVTVVVDDSPAAKAGLKEHDILLTANGKKLTELNDLVEIIRAGKGEEISLTLVRQGESMSLTVKPAKNLNSTTWAIWGSTTAILLSAPSRARNDSGRVSRRFAESSSVRSSHWVAAVLRAPWARVMTNRPRPVARSQSIGLRL